METVNLGEIRRRAVISWDTKWNKDWMLPKLNPRISFAYPISSFDFVRPSPDFDSECHFPTNQHPNTSLPYGSRPCCYTPVWCECQHENYWHDPGSTSPTGDSHREKLNMSTTVTCLVKLTVVCMQVLVLAVGSGRRRNSAFMPVTRIWKSTHTGSILTVTVTVTLF